MTFRTLLACAALLLTLSSTATESGIPGASEKGQLPKPNTEDMYRPFLINSVFNYYGNNGGGSYNPFSNNNEGFEFPKRSLKTLVFEDGVIWGGFHKGRSVAKVGGSMYKHGLSAGPIIVNGTITTDPTGDDATSPANRVYRVRPDISPRVKQDVAMSMIDSSELPYISRYEKYTVDQIYQQYITDWNEWPAAEGAPFAYGVDASGNQRSAPLPYDPKFDTPGVPGAAQTLWYVANDCNVTRTVNFAGSPVIGLEMQRTIWGYDTQGAFGNTIFTSTLIINKSGAKIDTMYVGQWCDPDVGDAGDDFAGCDTSRDLGYAYNGEAVDAVYGTAVPAVGFALLQGPIVPSPGDTAAFKFGRRAGFRNLRMTSFEIFFPVFDFEPPPSDEQSCYWELQGLLGQSGASILDPFSGRPTKFEVPGNPVTGTGWIDGQYGFPPQDRRFLMGSGPFSMAPGDTQEIVTSLIGGAGADRLSSITVLCAETDGIRNAFKNLLAIPSPPQAPNVLAAALDREVVLTWGDSATIAATEGTVNQGYGFEGYKIYEYLDAAGNDPVLLATCDAVDGIKTIADTVYDAASGLYLIKIIQRGTDNGIIHSINITSSKETGSPLSNGSSYYFGVTAYSYSGSPPAISGTHSLESSPRIVTVIPHAPNPGSRLSQLPGDGLAVSVTLAPGSARTDGIVTATVVDPTRVTGDTYAVTINGDSAKQNLTWTLTDQTKNAVLLSNGTNFSGNSNYPIVDGVQIRVIGAPGGTGMRPGDQYLNPGDTSKWGWYVPSGSLKWTPHNADPLGAFHLEGFTLGGKYPGAIGNAYDHWFSGGVPYLRLKDVLIKFAGTDSTWDPKAEPRDSNFSRGYRYVRRATDTTTFALHPGWSALITNRSTGYAYQDYNYSMPFSAWNVDVNPPVRLAVGHLENNAAGGMVDGKCWPPSDAMPGADNTVSREWWFIFDAAYTDPVPNPALTIDLLSTPTPMMWIGMPNRTADSYSAGDEFMILAHHPLLPGDMFTFSTRAPTAGDVAVARADVTKINVFPNPYGVFSPASPGPMPGFVTFTHLPQRAVIRVFSLGGVLVKTMLKDDPGQFLSWNMQNEVGRQVASGIYIVYIDMPDLGSTKTLKLGVFAETY